MSDLDKIDNFASAMIKAATIDDLLWSIAKTIGETLAFDDCVIYLKEGYTLQQKAAFGVKNPECRQLLNEIEINLGEGIVGYVAQTGIAEIIPNTQNDKRYIWDEFSGQSELTVPVLYEGETIAIIDTESATLDYYTEEDMRLLQVIAKIASPRIVSAITCSQLHQAKKQLKESNMQLEFTISQLKQNQETLVHSEKMASVGLLAAGIAHEINNPLGFSLSNMSVMADYVREIKSVNNRLMSCKVMEENSKSHISSNEYQMMLEDMRCIVLETTDGLIRIKNIVADLCGYVRTEDKQHDYFDVNEAVRASANLLRGEIKGHCQLDLQLEAMPLLYGVSGKINQVIMNVLHNAIQASPDESIVKIKSYSNNSEVVIEISDSGSGIAAENLKDIFTPFYTTKPVGEGTGLGLFICYKIIKEEHEGDINVVSSNQNGTTFRITLPLPTCNHVSLKVG